jgi:hypothetical protein
MEICCVNEERWGSGQNRRRAGNTTRLSFRACTEEINTALSQDSGMIEEFDDIRTRQFIGSIRVLDKECLLIRFRDGTESDQHVRKEKD